MCLAQGLKAQELHSSLSAHQRIHLPVIHVVTLLVLAAPSLSQPTTSRSTTWTARSSPGTLYRSSTTSTPRPSPRTPRSSSSSIPSSNKVGKNRYKSSLWQRNPEWQNPANNPLHRLWAQISRDRRVWTQRACDQGVHDDFEKFSGRHLSIFWSTKRILENKINKLRLLKKWRNLGKLEHKA